jgi:hypothetical protein
MGRMVGYARKGPGVRANIQPKYCGKCSGVSGELGFSVFCRRVGEAC